MDGGQSEQSTFKLHSSHWGIFSARRNGDRLDVRPYADDPDPSPMLGNFTNALNHPARIAQPMIRQGWLERGAGPDARRGREAFVPVSWDVVTDLLAGELRRVRDGHGPGAVFGGSYGWASAGRFHHAQSQIHRFLNIAMGGYVRSVNSYSAGASAVIVPHVLGDYSGLTMHNVTWQQVAEETEVVLAFGGLALKNSAVAGGGISQHVERGAIAAARARGCRFLLFGPLRPDMPAEAEAEWINLVPGTDTALMLALVYCLVKDNKHDIGFLERYCVGWEKFEAYVLGVTDGQPKTAAWAEAISGVPAAQIAAIASQLAGKRVLVTVAHSLQRSEHGEQPVWMGAVLAAVLGQYGLPGGGFGYAMGAIGYYGRRNNAVPGPTLGQGQNGVEDFIPVARIADMLLNPGERYRYNGETRRYPDIRLVYWAGGNPFHHHQDLNRLRQAFARVDTLVVHEQAWTATARHADIVLPATMSLEREDIGYSSNDPVMVAMHRLAEPYGEARDDYTIFAGLAAALDVGERFTEGRDSRAWLAHLYERTRSALEAQNLPAPGFAEFWEQGKLVVPQKPDDGGYLRAFRDDPDTHPLKTPSGRIEIYSETIAGFGEADCPPHPAWMDKRSAPDRAAPFYLVANQPATRLHSQLDFGAFSQSSKHRGREVATLHPADAAAKGIADGDIIKLFNQRGACLAAARLSDGVSPGVIQLATGAWYDPQDPEDEKPLCVHGNPNVLTLDVGTSNLAQGCTGQLTAVNVEKFEGNLPPIRAYEPPRGALLKAGD
ncbi:molybdopterin-dependent oxidoreductase [Acidisoma silvae]|nr:molybdopterin-dependent oxidoreductase [Acidisoma silvae]